MSHNTHDKLPALSFEVLIINESQQAAIENLISSKPELIKKASIPYQGYSINLQQINGEWIALIFKESAQILKMQPTFSSYQNILAEAKHRIKDVIIERDIFHKE